MKQSILYNYRLNCKRKCLSKWNKENLLLSLENDCSLKSNFIDPSGRLVNYKQLRSSEIYRDINEISKHLITINLDNITENERKTFFISKLFFIELIFFYFNIYLSFRYLQYINYSWNCFIK